MRENFNLNFNWKFHLGEIERVMPKAIGPTYMHSKSRSGLGVETKDFIDDSFETVNLPHDYVVEGDVQESNGSHGSLIRENAWYRKAFTVERKTPNDRFVIMFEGISTKSEIWFNGHLVGKNESGYNSFYVDVTAYILDSDDYNLLCVHVINDDFEGWWYEGGGIYRNVHLIQTSELAVDVWGTWVNPVKTSENTWNVEIETTVYNQSENPCSVNLKQEIFNENNELVGTCECGQAVQFGKNKCHCQIEIENPELWGIENPNLYYLKTSLVNADEKLDEYTTKFGFRTIKCDNAKGFFLNGKFTKIRGVCLHQDHANMGVAFNKSVWKYRLEILKEGGVNACRCSHGNPAPEFLDLCDEMGFVVMDENRRFTFSETAKTELKSMVYRDRNHPSVIMWSVGNEEPLHVTMVGKRLLASMKNYIKQFDNTRPVTLVLSGGYNPETDISDFTCFNYQIENYENLYSLNGNKLIITGEAGASDNNRGIYFVDDAEAYNSNYATAYDLKRRKFSDSYFSSIKACEEREYVGGTFLWAGFDYRGESLWPKLFCGVAPIDSCGFKKDNFYMMKAIWNEEKMQHIMPHWNFDENVGDIEVWVYTNISETELFLNGKSLGRKNSGKFNPAVWTVPYEKGSLKAVGYENGKEILVTENVTTKKAVKLHSLVQNVPKNTGMDCVVIDFYMTDEDGKTVPTANNMLEFEADENLEIIAVSNGDPMDRTNAKSLSRRMFNGSIQMIAKVLKNAKTANFKVTDKENNSVLEQKIEIENAKELVCVQDYTSKAYLNSFRHWNSLDIENPMDYEFNFDDMNSNLLIDMNNLKLDLSKKYTILTTSTNLAVFENEIYFQIENFKGKASLKLIDKENNKIVIKEINEEKINTVNVLCEGFASNAKVDIVLAVQNANDAKISKMTFTAKV